MGKGGADCLIKTNNPKLLNRVNNSFLRMLKEKSHFKYFKNIIYKGDTLEISTEKTKSSLKTLLMVLRDGALRRREIIQRTCWTEGQLAGHLNLGQKKGLIRLKNRKIYAIIK